MTLRTDIFLYTEKLSYIEVTKKNLGNIPNVKFFTVDPYFGGIFKVERPKEAKNSTFWHF